MPKYKKLFFTCKGPTLATQHASPCMVLANQGLRRCLFACNILPGSLKITPEITNIADFFQLIRACFARKFAWNAISQRTAKIASLSEFISIMPNYADLILIKSMKYL